MPSFDIVCSLNVHEMQNAVDQAGREILTRFDFKGVDARYEWDKEQVVLVAQSEFQCQQMLDILRGKMIKRQLDVAHLDPQAVEEKFQVAKQVIQLKNGIDQETAKGIVKQIKQAGLKVQASIQGDQVRITGKKRDDLQSVIALMRESQQTMPLNYENFRD